MERSFEAAYDEWVGPYVDLNINVLEQFPSERDTLDQFAARTNGLVLDLGCGPGHTTNYLRTWGTDVIGYDLSSKMITEATRRFPDTTFASADLAALPHGDNAIGGIVSRYSLIHMDPTDLQPIFEHWAQLMGPGAPLLLSFFAAATPDTHGDAFDHTVATAYQLSPEVLAGRLETAGFEQLDVSVEPPPWGGRPIDHGVIRAVAGPG